MQEVTCPSGLRVVLRGLTVADEDLMVRANAKGGNSPVMAVTLLNDLARACVVRVVDVGPYPDLDPAAFDPAKLLSGDRLFLMVQMRICSYGNEVDVRGSCPKGHGFESSLDLAKLESYPLSADAAAKFRAKIPFSFALPTLKRTVTFFPARGEDEERAAKLLKRGEDMGSEELATRIKTISGFDPKTGLDETGRDFRAFIRAMPVRDAADLRAEMERVECGIQLTVDSECEECGAQGTVSLLDVLSFFGTRRNRRSGSRG